MNIVLPKNVRTIIERLEGCGHEAYAVGGCVRDSVLGKNLPTGILPPPPCRHRSRKFFRRPWIRESFTDRHGSSGGGALEVTTYRVDGEYEDARHPREVSFTKSLPE